jgi:hypothetical protein
MAIGEAGSISTNSPTENQPITVVLTEALTNPVFAFTATSNGTDDFLIRLVGQTLDGDGNTTAFTFIIEEWEYLDGPHPEIETINWLAIEEGVHTLPDGRLVEAGTSSIASSGRNTGGTETFSAGFTSPPVVLTSVMSNNDPTTVDSDPSAISTTGFRITLQEEEALNSVHSAETIGWIAIQPGGDGSSGTAGNTGNTVTHNVSTVGLGATFTDGVVLAETQTLDGPDTATVSIDSQTDSAVGVFINEEQSRGTETNHTTEVVGIVAFEDGLIPCLTRGSRVKTPHGCVPIEDLKRGDLVTTASNGPQPIRWIGTRRYGRQDFEELPQLSPVRISAGALGKGKPVRDLLVSRQHRIRVCSKIAERMFGTPEVLISAIRLTELPGVWVDEAVPVVDYVHILFDRHEIVFAEGVPTESLYTGPEALRALSEDARAEILTMFPELACPANIPVPAHLIPLGKRQKQFVARHLKNALPVLADETH